MDNSEAPPETVEEYLARGGEITPCPSITGAPPEGTNSLDTLGAVSVRPKSFERDGGRRR